MKMTLHCCSNFSLAPHWLKSERCAVSGQRRVAAVPRETVLMTLCLLLLANTSKQHLGGHLSSRTMWGIMSLTPKVSRPDPELWCQPVPVPAQKQKCWRQLGPTQWEWWISARWWESRINQNPFHLETISCLFLCLQTISCLFFILETDRFQHKNAFSPQTSEPHYIATYLLKLLKQWLFQGLGLCQSMSMWNGPVYIGYRMLNIT